MDAGRQRRALRRMAAEDPELAARLVLMTLPGAAARIGEPLAWELAVEGLGRYRVSVADGDARIEPSDGDGATDFQIATDARGLAQLAGGASAARLVLGGRMRIRGSRRKALKLRRMSAAEPTLDEVARAGGRIDPDPLYRALPYLVDPEWTRGHRFAVRYEVTGAGAWLVEARDGEPLRVTTDGSARPDAVARVSEDTYRRLVAGELSPTLAMQQQLSEIEGDIYPVTLLGRWIERAQGRDDAELQREERQRRVQERRGRTLAPGGNGAGMELLDYRQLYALWERQGWRASEIDFTVDKEHWLATPTLAQENQTWTLGSFYVGEQRVTADLAPFLTAAPSGEIELFLGTQLVDEARHAAFFDRFGAEVMALSAEDLRGRIRELEQVLQSPWREVFDDGLRDVANRIKARPDDFGLFVEGIATYHLVVEGFLAVTGQAMIRDYMLEHGLYPGFCHGFGLVERDEHRHIAFGVRFLKDAIEQDARHAAVIERTVAELARPAAYVFKPPYVDDPREFVSYGYRSSEIYGYAYRALKRRMGVLGLELPPPEELMPGPIDKPSPVAA
jgi:ribonucleoside-diphosphate reductase beta chain